MKNEPGDCTSVKGHTLVDKTDRSAWPDEVELDGPEESETAAVAKSMNREHTHKQMGTTGRKGRD
jgi:hypothetical protein